METVSLFWWHIPSIVISRGLCIQSYFWRLFVFEALLPKSRSRISFRRSFVIYTRQKSLPLGLEAGLGVVPSVEDCSVVGTKMSFLTFEYKEQLREQMSSQKVPSNDLDLHGLGNEWVGMRSSTWWRS